MDSFDTSNSEVVLHVSRRSSAAATMSSVAEKKGQAVEEARAKVDDIKPAVTTEENKDLKEYSRALLEQAIEIGKGNEHYDKYSFVQLPYAKLQNGSKAPLVYDIHRAERAHGKPQSDACCFACRRLHPSHR